MYKNNTKELMFKLVLIGAIMNFILSLFSILTIPHLIYSFIIIPLLIYVLFIFLAYNHNEKWIKILSLYGVYLLERFWTTFQLLEVIKIQAPIDLIFGPFTLSQLNYTYLFMGADLLLGVSLVYFLGKALTDIGKTS